MLWLRASLVCTVLLLPAGAYAIAFCDLRDPTHQIYELYPEATGYRSLVETVDRDVKKEVGEQLMFTIHNRELGKHTLYVALRDESPIGLVHVRSEASGWGLVEIVWSIDLELRIQDFRFQRCRETGCAAVRDVLAEKLAGKALGELHEVFGGDAGTSPEDVAGIANRDRRLAQSVIRSALKTLLITEMVWGDQVPKVNS